MKFKVGQKVRAKGDQWFNKGELLKIIELYRSDRTYRCKGTNETLWQPECNLEPFTSFQEKLDRFMKEPVGFLVKSKEIADELSKVFEREHMKTRSGCGIRGFMEDAIEESMEYPGDPYVTHNIRGDNRLSYGTSDFMDQAVRPRELLDVTLDELKEYLGSSSRTLEDFKGNRQEEHMKITIETDGHHKTTAECNGITAESLCNPTDEFKLPKGVHMAVQRLLEKIEKPEEDTGFHVGDIVEVVANERNYIGDPVGLQAVVTGVGKDGARINIPIPGSSLYFYDRELKLIRRGNN